MVSAFASLNITAYANVMTYDQAVSYVSDCFDRKDSNMSFDVECAGDIDWTPIHAIFQCGYLKVPYTVDYNKYGYCPIKYLAWSQPDRDNPDIKHIRYEIDQSSFDEILAQDEVIEDEINRIFTKYNIYSLNDYGKIKAIHDYMYKNIKYDYDAYNAGAIDNSATVYSALIRKKAVCSGYSRTFIKLCNKAGIECFEVSGNAINNDPYNGGHAWDVVRLNGTYYLIDVTWDSCLEGYDYFLKNEAEFSKKHVPNKSYDVPISRTNFNCENDGGVNHSYKKNAEQYCYVCGAKNKDYKSNQNSSSKPSTEKNNLSNAPIKINSIKAGKKSFTVSWAKRSNAQGYVIQYSTSKSFPAKTTKSVTVKSGTKKTVKSLKAKKKYYIRIRAYKTVNDKKYYSKWSSKTTVKTK